LYYQAYTFFCVISFVFSSCLASPILAKHDVGN
jgi:hypothetical protein